MARRPWPLLVLGLLAGGAAGWWLRGDTAGPDASPDDVAHGDDEAEGDASTLRRRNDELARENQELRRRADAARARRRADDGAATADPESGPSGGGPRRVGGSTTRAERAAGSAAGSEVPETTFEAIPLVGASNMRLRVQQPPVAVNVPEDAKAILDALRTALEKGNLPLAQSLQMALILKGKAAVDPLLAALRDPQCPPALAQHALGALEYLDAPGLGGVAEDLARRSGVTDAVRDLALGAAVAGDPAGALPVIQRLLASSDPDDAARARKALGRAGDKSYLPILTEEVRRTDRTSHANELAGAIARLKDKPWSAFQMTGEPDTPSTGDFGTAWAAKNAQMGLVQLELDYDEAVVPDVVRIRETLAAGAVVKIESKGVGSGWETLWEGDAAAATAPRWFEPSLATASRAARTIRVTLDTDRVEGWNEIDAVELVGGGRRQWATGARASSSYSD